jgi:uncharacterized Zn-finger protein
MIFNRFSFDETQQNFKLEEEDNLNYSELCNARDQTKKPIGKPKKNNQYNFELHPGSIEEERNRETGRIWRQTMTSCPICGKELKQSSLRKHIKRIHQKAKYFFCDLCGRGYLKKWHLSSHILKHIPKEFREKNSEKPLWPCKCGEIFNSEYNLYHHKRLVHNKENMRTCKKNEKVVANGKSSHENFKYSCDYPNCDRKFKTLTQVSRHKKFFHLGLRPFICSYKNCKKAFSRNEKLTRHIKVTHEKLKAKCPVNCCSFMSGRRDNMRNHLKKHIELKPEVLETFLGSVKNMKIA